MMNPPPWTEFYRGRSVLVTGGLGFIGSNLVHALVGLGSRVTVLDALVEAHGGHPFNLHPVEDRVRVVIADLRQREVVEPLVAEAEVIFNLAGQVSHIASLEDPLADLHYNLTGHIVFLEACRRRNPTARVVYAATRSEYGRAQRLPVTEDHPLRPLDPNGIHKMAAEAYHWLYHHLYGIPTASLRLINTYGPRHQMKSPRGCFVHWLLRLAFEDREIPVFGTGQQRRDLNYVDDVVEAFLRVGAATDVAGEVFNLGSPETHAVLEIAELIVELTGRGRIRLTPFPPQHRAIEVGDFQTDFRKIRERLGWAPRTDLRTGLRRTVEFYERYWDVYIEPFRD